MDLKGASAAARQNEGVAPSIHQEEVLRCGGGGGRRSRAGHP